MAGSLYTFPDGRPETSGPDWEYFCFSDSTAYEMVESGDGLFEFVMLVRTGKEPVLSD